LDRPRGGNAALGILARAGGTGKVIQRCRHDRAPGETGDALTGAHAAGRALLAMSHIL